MFLLLHLSSLFFAQLLTTMLEIKKAVNQAQLTYDLVNKHWEPFCLVVRLLFHKRLMPSQEAIEAAKEKDAQEHSAMHASFMSVDKDNTGIRTDEPKKVFNPRKLELIKQAYDLVILLIIYGIVFAKNVFYFYLTIFQKNKPSIDQVPLQR